VAEQSVRTGVRVRAQPVADIDGQHDATIVATRYPLVGNNIAEPTDVDPALIHTVVQGTVAAPVLGGQRQLHRRCDRSVNA
jgi:hypothetical protein